MIPKLIAFFARFTAHPDKVLHAIVGALLFGLVLWLAGSADVALGAAVIVGAGKEWYDRRQPGHTADWLDAAATVAPALLLWWLLDAGVLPAWPIG